MQYRIFRTLKEGPSRFVVIAVLCLLTGAVVSPVRAQDVPEPEVIPMTYVARDLSISGRTVVWDGGTTIPRGVMNPFYRETAIYAVNLNTLERIAIAEDDTRTQVRSFTNGEIITWIESPAVTDPNDEIGPWSLQGYDLATGATFVIVDNPQNSSGLPAYVLDGDLVAWGEETGAQQWRVMARNIRTLEPAFEVATDITTTPTDGSSPRLRLHLSGTTIFWYEAYSEAVGQRPIMFRDISTMDSPQTLVTTDKRIQFSGDRAIWHDLEQNDWYAIQPGNTEPTVVIDDALGRFYSGRAPTFDRERAVYIGEQGLTEVRLADGVSRVLDSNVLTGYPPQTNGSQTCWVQDYYAIFVSSRLFCHDHADQRTIELPPVSDEISDVHLVDDTLLWTQSYAAPGSPSDMHVVSLSALFAALPPAPPLQITEPSFQQLWEQYDGSVATGASQRSWTWGPAPLTPDLDPTSAFATQYFDKARMEINDPDADPNDPWYVTTGLLPVELMTGDPDSYSLSGRPAPIAAVGDPGGFPTYADLGVLFDREGSSPADAFDQPITARFQPDDTLDRTGQQAFVADPNTTLVASPTGSDYGVPQAFATFMRQYQPEGEQGFDPLFVFGLPVTEAVWVDATVGDVEMPVLVQVFERRVLTYNPANSPAFQVEMGNVGRHYLQWREGA